MWPYSVMAEGSIFKGGDTVWERLLNGVNVAETEEDKNADWEQSFKALTGSPFRATTVQCCVEPDCKLLSSEQWGCRGNGYGFLQEVCLAVWRRLEEPAGSEGAFFIGGYTSIFEEEKELAYNSLHNFILITD